MTAFTWFVIGFCSAFVVSILVGLLLARVLFR